jgi:hypothetical protein
LSEASALISHLADNGARYGASIADQVRPGSGLMPLPPPSYAIVEANPGGKESEGPALAIADCGSRRRRQLGTHAVSAQEASTTLSPRALQEIAQVEAEIDRNRGSDGRTFGQGAG